MTKETKNEYLVTPFTYLSGKTPSDYICKTCGAGGCKLWREYQTFAPTLLCADCACKDQKKTNDVDESGMRSSQHGGRTDQIGWYVPSVPTEDGYGYWGYSSVPQQGVDWWKQLPLRAPAPAEAPAKANQVKKK